MKTITTILFLIGFLLFSCENQRTKTENLICNQELIETQAELDELKEMSQSGIRHLVLLKLKKGTTDEQENIIINTLSELETIEQVRFLNIGKLVETGDSRALSGYDLVLQLNFANTDDLASYQQNEFHIQIRDKLAPSYEGQPIIIDYSLD